MFRQLEASKAVLEMLLGKRIRTDRITEEELFDGKRMGVLKAYLQDRKKLVEEALQGSRLQETAVRNL